MIDIEKIPKFHMFTNNVVQNYSRCTKKCNIFELFKISYLFDHEESKNFLFSGIA